MLFLHTRGANVRVEKLCFLLFASFWPILAGFLQILPQIKNFFQKSKCAHILILDANFVPKLTFLGLLSPEISFGEKNSHPPRHPAYFASCENYIIKRLSEPWHHRARLADCAGISLWAIHYLDNFTADEIINKMGQKHGSSVLELTCKWIVLHMSKIPHKYLF